MLKSPSANAEDIKRYEFNPWVRKSPWRREWQPTSVFLPEESHGLRSLAEYSPWGNKKSDIIKRLIHTHFYITESQHGINK